MENTFWIWYPGDFELYHAMKQNFSRVERGLDGRHFGRVRLPQPCGFPPDL